MTTALKEAAATAPADRWIYGTIGGRALGDPQATRDTLDRVAPGRKVKLSAWTGHGNILSSEAMRALGIGDRDPDPPHGRYGRGAGGRLNGLLEEYADTRANRRLNALVDREHLVASLRSLSDEAVGYGITSLQVFGNAVPAGKLADLISATATPIRWRVIRWPLAVRMEDDPEDYAPVSSRATDNVVVSGEKWILDGTPVERLAAMREAYADQPGWTGRLNLSASEIGTVLRRSLTTGEQILLHVAGDRSLDLVFDTMENIAPADRWQRARLRIEHGDWLTTDRIARGRRLGVVIVQNPSHFTIGDIFRARFGAERAGRLQPVKAYMDAGLAFALGSDGPINPFLNIMFATTHPTNPSQALTREQAVSAYTSGSAYAQFAEKEKGRLAAGMLADVAVLSQDIFAIPPDRLPATEAVMTIIGGRIVLDKMR